MMTIVSRSSSMIHPRMSGAVALPTKWFGLPWLSSCDTLSQWEVGHHMVVVLLVKCTASKDNPKNGRSSSNPCQLLDTVLQLPPPSLPLLPVGGATDIRDSEAVLCDTVEVCNSETSQWHTADPLPVPCGLMTSVTIADTWYLLGGVGTDDKDLTAVLYTPLTTLIQKATSPTHQSASSMSVWKTLPDTPLVGSAAASLSGNLF